MLHTVPTVCALNQKHENKAPQSLYHSAWKLCHAFSTFCFFKPTNTYFSLTHTNSTDYLLPFFFFSPSHKEHTHTNTLKLLGLASGVVINHQSEWLWFLQHQQSRGWEGEDGGWGVEHRAGGPVRRLQLNGCPRFLCLSSPERATAQPLGATHCRSPTSVTEAHGLNNPL